MDTEPLITVDWKSAGKEFLPLFPYYYESIACLHQPAYERLVDHLANEPVESCLASLAYYLSFFQIDLWNLDSGGDQYDLMLSAQAQRDETRQRMNEFCDDEDDLNALELVLIAPAPDAQIDQILSENNQASSKKKKSSSKKEKSGKKKPTAFQWLADSYDMGDYMHVSRYNYFDGFVEHWDTPENDEPEFPILFDFNQWVPGEIKPLENVPALATQTLSRMSLHLAYKDNEIMVWKQVTRTVEHRDYFTFKLQRGNDWHHWGDSTAELTHYFQPSIVVGENVYHIEENSLYKVSQQQTRKVFESPSRLYACKLDGGRILLLQEESLELFLLDDVTDIVTPLDARFEQAPYDPEELTYLGDDNVLVFFRDIVPHPTRPEYSESFMRAGIFNIKNRSMKYAKLEGIESRHKFNARFLKTQPNDYVMLRSFDGNLKVNKGHDDWWIWNQQTNAFGVSARVWFWNQTSNEVIKIDSQKMPRLEPDVVYSTGLGRYLFFDGTECALMADFDQVADYAGIEKLSWEDA